MPFQFVPSACYFQNHAGLGIYVKYHAKKTDDIVVKYSDSGCLWLDTPDRELFIVSDQHMYRNRRPIDGNFDEFVPLSPFHNSMHEWGLDRIMVNYIQNTRGTPQAVDLRAPERLQKDHKVKIVSDSGGFQLLTGATDFVDPEKLQEWYNNNVDEGVVLDLPTLNCEQDVIIRAAKLQKRNTNILLDNKADHVELINVVHGHNPTQYNAYHDQVQDDRISKLCIANAYSGNIVNSTADVMTTMNMGWGYKHYHLLGVYNLSVTPIYIRASNSNIVPPNTLVTSDSSTALQVSNYRTYLMQRYDNRPQEHMEIGRTVSFHKPASYRRLACQCSVCATLKYTDIFSYAPHSMVSFMMMMHNIHEVTRYFKMMDEFSRVLTAKEYRKLVSDQLVNHPSRNFTLRGLDLLEVMAEEGHKVARNKFSLYFSHSRMIATSEEKKMEIAQRAENAALDMEGTVDADVPLHTRVPLIIGLYKEYHAKNLDLHKLHADNERIRKKRIASGKEQRRTEQTTSGKKKRKLLTEDAKSNLATGDGFDRVSKSQAGARYNKKIKRQKAKRTKAA